MKKFKQLVKELPSKKVIFAFGRYQPPTIGHGLLVQAVKHIAQKQSADHVIYASRTQDKKSNPLPVDRKVYYLKRMFPSTNFVAANENVRTFLEAIKELNKKYKNLVMVAGSDRVAEYQKILDKYNGKDFKFDTIEVVSAGERDPDADGASGMSGTKMRDAAKKGDFASFKKGLPSTLTTQDAKRLMNELRSAMGVEAVKESIQFDRDELREQYHAGKIFNIGEKVKDDRGVYEIVDRGTNYITVVNESGDLSKKWIDAVEYAQIAEDVQPGPAPEEITFKGYTTKNLHHSHDATKAFQSTIDRLESGAVHNDPVAVLNALKATDTYMKINDLHLEQGVPPKKDELETWRDAHVKARDALQRLGEFMHHQDYWHAHQHEIEQMVANYDVPNAGAEFADSYTPEGNLLEMKFTSADKIKVARIIATTLGVAEVEKKSNPEQLVNDALRKIRSKPMRPEYIDVLHNMLGTAKEAGISYDEKLVPKKAQAVSEATDVENKANVLSDLYAQLANAKVMGRPTDEIMRRIAQYRYDLPDQENRKPVNTSDVTPEIAIKSAQQSKVGHAIAPTDTEHTRKMKIKYHTEEVEKEDEGEDDYEMDDDELEDMVNSIESEDDILDAYEDDEVAMVDDETGEEIEDEDDEEKKVNEDALNEVLSRAERMRAKVRFAKTKAKRERKIKIALKRRSNTATINNRSRRLAVKLMKQRIAKKPLNSLSVSEKERIEGIIQRRKAVINRLAMKLVPRVKKIEQERLTHRTYTK